MNAATTVQLLATLADDYEYDLSLAEQGAYHDSVVLRSQCELYEVALRLIEEEWVVHFVAPDGQADVRLTGVDFGGLTEALDNLISLEDSL